MLFNSFIQKVVQGHLLTIYSDDERDLVSFEDESFIVESSRVKCLLESKLETSLS